jgi:hypothetical protein
MIFSSLLPKISLTATDVPVYNLITGVNPVMQLLVKNKELIY